MEAALVSLCALHHGNRYSDSIAVLVVTDQRVVPKGLAFGGLSPATSGMKLSHTVLRGLGASNGHRLPAWQRNLRRQEDKG
jgi:hypothetical protein